VTYLFAHPFAVLQRLAEHVELTVLALVAASAIALPLGIFVAKNERAGRLVLGVLNTVYTLPSLAVFALLIPVLGIGTLTALVALVAYAQMILVRNVAAGLRGVPRATVDAARGLGMTPAQSLWRVELPQALPVIIGGIRIATVTLIALASLAAWINAGGLGVLILYGLQHDDPGRAVTGSVLAAALAIGADTALRRLERRVRTG
jgi:osmoprotectant transport system permease protein